MANGTKTANIIGALATTDTAAKCCIDAEYGLIYHWNSSNGFLYAINIETGVSTQLIAFGAGETPNFATEPTSAGKIWTYYANSSFPCRIWNITDRATGAGNLTTSASTLAAKGTGEPVIYHNATHTNYIMQKSTNTLSIGVHNLKTLTSLSLLQTGITYSTVGTEYPQFHAFCKVGNDLIVGSCRATGTNPNQLFVYNILTNTYYWLDNYYASVNGGTNLTMFTTAIFAIGNSVNFYNKGYKYTYDFNQEVTKPDMNAWSRTTHSLSGAGYADDGTLTVNTTISAYGNSYILGGTYNAVNQNKIVKASYFLPSPTNIDAKVVNGKVQFTWTDNSDEETYYVIERKRQDETIYTQVSVDGELVGTGTGNTITWVDETALINTYNYSYSIKARLIEI